MGTPCSRFIFVLIWKRCHVVSFWDKEDIIETFNSTSRYLDDLLNNDNIYFDGLVKQIYPSELQLNKANSSDTEATSLVYIWLFQMILFLLKFMINAMILILIL